MDSNSLYRIIVNCFWCELRCLGHWIGLLSLLVIWEIIGNLPVWAGETEIPATVQHIVSLGDRSTGSPGAKRSADFIASEFKRIGLKDVGAHQFSLPMRMVSKSTIQLSDHKSPLSIDPMMLNAVSPGTIPEPGIQAPLIYVGRGELSEFNGKAIKDAVVLMELTSGRNWINAASLGAKALIYVDRGPTANIFYKDKFELTPVDFPRLRLSIETARRYFGDFESRPDGVVSPWIRLQSDIHWQKVQSENIYGLIQGSDPDLEKNFILVEAFYDSGGVIPGKNKGADEAIGIATLLEVARYLKHHPPPRSVILVATSGHGQTLTGMREMIWSISSKSKELRSDEKRLKKVIRDNNAQLKLLETAFNSPGNDHNLDVRLLKTAMTDSIKNEVDRISHQLMQLRMDRRQQSDPEKTQNLTRQRLRLRRLDWKEDFSFLTKDETLLLINLIPNARKRLFAQAQDAERQLAFLKSTRAFRRLIKSGELDLVVSLHLSSHGDGIGAFNRGFLHPLKSTINRVPAYSFLDKVLHQ
ncbi:MAG: M28 family peptidase, partial [Desulfobacteraceae bacterium]